MWRPPSTKTFWDIDKMKVGDEISLTWDNKLYTYKVAKTYIVNPNRVDILANTKVPKLTLFSCTPKFTSKKRLVVEAYPVGSIHNATLEAK
jgi:LPXTG-site transpeptidase (sortase) family protein